MPAVPAATQPASLYEVVIKRLRDRCPIFNNRVGGTSELGATYAVLASTADIEVPQAWVIPMHENDESQELAILEDSHNFPQHQVAEYFSVMVAVPNGEQGGMAGKGNFSMRAHAAIEEARRQIRKALMGWRIRPQFTPCRLSGGDHLAMNNKYLWHVWQYKFSDFVQPLLTTEEENARAALYAKVNGMSDDIPYANSILPRLRQIHVRYWAGTGHSKATTQDYYDDEAPPSAPTEEQINAAIGLATSTIEVDVDEGVPPPEPTPEQIGSKVFHAAHFDDFWLHGPETIEPAPEDRIDPGPSLYDS